MTAMGIGEAARGTGLSIDTLRFYEREGLTPGPVARDAAGRRAYSDEDLEWLLMTSRLRLTKMPIAEIRRYARLVRAGDSTVQQRFAMLRDHECAVRAQIAELQGALDAIGRKVGVYESQLDDGTAPASQKVSRTSRKRGGPVTPEAVPECGPDPGGCRQPAPAGAANET